MGVGGRVQAGDAVNPRTYKKQAKRAVELLRSHGDSTIYVLSEESGVIDIPMKYPRIKWLRRADPARYHLWQRIGSIPEHHYICFDEWDGHDARAGWIRHYDHSRLPQGYWEGPEWESGGKPWPRLTTKQRMNMWRFNQIAPGWRWRGGRAVKVKS